MDAGTEAVYIRGRIIGQMARIEGHLDLITVAYLAPSGPRGQSLLRMSILDKLSLKEKIDVLEHVLGALGIDGQQELLASLRRCKDRRNILAHQIGGAETKDGEPTGDLAYMALKRGRIVENRFNVTEALQELEAAEQAVLRLVKLVAERQQPDSSEG